MKDYGGRKEVWERYLRDTIVRIWRQTGFRMAEKKNLPNLSMSNPCLTSYIFSLPATVMHKDAPVGNFSEIPTQSLAGMW